LFFKACAELSDYANNTPGPLPHSSSPPSPVRQYPNLRPYANTAPQSAVTEKQPITKRFPTASASEGSFASSSFSPAINGTREYGSPFKLIDEKQLRKENESASKKPESPRNRQDLEAIKRTDGPNKDNLGSRVDHINAEPIKPTAGSEQQPLAAKKNLNDHTNHDTVADKSRKPASPHKGHQPHRKEQEQIRTDAITKQEQIAIKKAFMSARADSPLPFASGLSKHSRIQHLEGDKRHDFIKGDYRSVNKDALQDPPLSRLQHLDLSHSTPPLRRLSSNSSVDNSNMASYEPTSRTLRPNNRAISQSSPDLPTYHGVPNSPLPAQNTPSSNSHQVTSSHQVASSLSQTQVVTPPRPKVTWEAQKSPLDEIPLRTQVTFSVPKADNLSPVVSTPIPRRPPSPISVPPADVHIAAAHLTRKNVSQQIQSLLPSPPSRPTSSSLAHSASAPSIINPTPQEPTGRNDFIADSPFRSPKSSFISPSGEGQRLSSSSANQYKSSRLPPPRPDTPSNFSPSVLSFDRTSSHELSQNDPNTPLPTPSMSSSPLCTLEQSEGLKVVENVNLMCVECRKQIGNKDVVVSFMHHYYHWACVRCYKCHQYVQLSFSRHRTNLLYKTTEF
jgi:hypothetical protein